jgi:hypothetical protein
MSARLFISYSSKDKPFVETLVPYIQKMDHDVYWDQDLIGGEVWWEKLLDEIQSRTHFIFIVSKDSLVSEYCKQEKNWAKSLKRNILCVKIDRNVENIDVQMAKIEQAQLIDGTDVEIEELSRQIDKAIQQKMTAPAIPNQAHKDRPLCPIQWYSEILKRITEGIITSNDEQLATDIDELRNRVRQPIYQNDAILILERLKEKEISRRRLHDIEDILVASKKPTSRSKRGPIQPPKKMIASPLDKSPAKSILNPLPRVSSQEIGLVIESIPRKNLQTYSILVQRFSECLQKELSNSEKLKKFLERFKILIDTPTYQRVSIELYRNPDLLVQVISESENDIDYNKLGNLLYNVCKEVETLVPN